MALIDKHLRFFVRHHISFRPRHKKGQPLEFISDDDTMDARTVIERAIVSDTAIFEIRSDDHVRLTKLDVRPNDEIAIFLFRRSDPLAAAQVLENRKTRKLRPVQIGADEFPAVSAHLFLNLKTQRLPNPTYSALLEEVPGLGRTYMHHVLHNAISEFKYTFKDAKGREKETYSILGFDGVPSEKIEDALKGSEVPYVELVRPGKIPGLDSAYVEAREQRMKLMIRADTPHKILQALGAIKTWMVDWAEMRVRLDLPEDRSRLISIARTQDAKDVLFIRSIEITTKGELPAATEIINEELVSKAKAIFKSKN